MKKLLLAFRKNLGRHIAGLLLVCLLLPMNSCKKFVTVPEPINSITTLETFSNDATANSEIVGIYSKMASYSESYVNGDITINSGMSADEFQQFGSPTLFQLNNLQTADGSSDLFWTQAYFNIYQANLAIEALKNSTGVSTQMKNQLIGEAEFIRAFDYFYLVNFYGDVPLVTTTAFAANETLPRTSVAKVYQLITSDLMDAQNLLAIDYSVSDGERTRPNKWAAKALLARVYLYQGDWKDAEAQATSVINNSSLYSLTDLNSVFLANSNEAIWQLQPDYTIRRPYTTYEGNSFIPIRATSNPNYYLTSELISAFEPLDQRRTAWVGSTQYAGQFYYYPFKYKIRLGTVGVVPAENIMVLRLAEQYLIRAEAEANGAGGGVNSAIGDLNVIRSRAGLPSLSTSLTKDSVLAAIAQERRIELFAEFGHRWLDLKRTGQATTVLSTEKGFTVSSNALLYPIPGYELQTDPKLTQNPGYLSK
ncbi:MAG TPA: RagB/SusD family nutrient uptake outer membrane protein [Mucilaginibacter sp.]|nr:RagB/SusD family nutrient uptake outer membrane protein [Mucilaginibacter sp.]